MKSMFNTLAQHNMLMAQIEANEGELTPELEERLTISDDRIQETVLFLLALVQTAEQNIMGAKVERDRLTEFIKTNEAHIDRFKGMLLDATRRLGSINAGSFRLTTRPSVSVVLGPNFQANAKLGKWVAPVEGYYSPDKLAIRKALQAGEKIEDAKLEERDNLQIK